MEEKELNFDVDTVYDLKCYDKKHKVTLVRSLTIYNQDGEIIEQIENWV